MIKKLVEHFMKKSCKRQAKKIKTEKVIKKNCDRLYVK